MGSGFEDRRTKARKNSNEQSPSNLPRSLNPPNRDADNPNSETLEPDKAGIDTLGLRAGRVGPHDNQTPKERKPAKPQYITDNPNPETGTTTKPRTTTKHMPSPRYLSKPTNSVDACGSVPPSPAGFSRTWHDVGYINKTQRYKKMCDWLRRNESKLNISRTYRIDGPWFHSGLTSLNFRTARTREATTPTQQPRSDSGLLQLRPGTTSESTPFEKPRLHSPPKSPPSRKSPASPETPNLNPSPGSQPSQLEP